MSGFIVWSSYIVLLPLQWVCVGWQQRSGNLVAAQASSIDRKQNALALITTPLVTHPKSSDCRTAILPPRVLQTDAPVKLLCTGLDAALHRAAIQSTDLHRSESPKDTECAHRSWLVRQPHVILSDRAPRHRTIAWWMLRFTHCDERAAVDLHGRRIASLQTSTRPSHDLNELEAPRQ